MLDEDEIVEADDITVDADEISRSKRLQRIDYSSKKVKISLYDDDGFSPAKEGNYKPVYHADPKWESRIPFQPQDHSDKKEEKRKPLLLGLLTGRAQVPEP